MKKTFIFIFIVFAFLQNNHAQKKLLTMEEAVVKQRAELAPAKLQQLIWIEGTDNYSYVENDSLMTDNLLFLRTAIYVHRK